MAESGPFRIDGEDWETDRAGQITRTKPAIPASTRTPPKTRAQRIQAQKIESRDRLNEQITEITAERDQLVTDIANLQTIIDNSV